MSPPETTVNLVKEAWWVSPPHAFTSLPPKEDDAQYGVDDTAPPQPGATWTLNKDCLERIARHADRNTQTRLMRVCTDLRGITAPHLYRILNSRFVESRMAAYRASLEPEPFTMDSLMGSECAFILPPRVGHKLIQSASPSAKEAKPSTVGPLNRINLVKYAKVLDLRGLELYWCGPMHWYLILDGARIQVVMQDYEGDGCSCFHCMTSMPTAPRSVVIDWKATPRALYASTHWCDGTDMRSSVISHAVVLFPVPMYPQPDTDKAPFRCSAAMPHAEWETLTIVLYPDWTRSAKPSTLRPFLHHLWQDLILLAARALSKVTIVGLEQAHNTSCIKLPSRAIQYARSIFIQGLDGLRGGEGKTQGRSVPAVDLMSLQYFEHTTTYDHALYGDKLDRWIFPPPGETGQGYW